MPKYKFELKPFVTIAEGKNEEEAFEKAEEVYEKIQDGIQWIVTELMGVKGEEND